jgi:hypothetical protein
MPIAVVEILLKNGFIATTAKRLNRQPMGFEN